MGTPRLGLFLAPPLTHGAAFGKPARLLASLPPVNVGVTLTYLARGGWEA